MVEDNFNFGDKEGQNLTPKRTQLEYPIDLEGEGSLRNSLNKILPEIIIDTIWNKFFYQTFIV